MTRKSRDLTIARANKSLAREHAEMLSALKAIRDAIDREDPNLPHDWLAARDIYAGDMNMFAAIAAVAEYAIRKAEGNE
jgi:hypothetical protein